MLRTLKNYILVLAVGIAGWSCNQSPVQEEVKTEVNTSAAPAQATEAPQEMAIPAQSEPDTLKGSLKAQARGQIGNANITVDYHSPAVRGRIVWGGLVPYNQVWVTGAHMATSFTTDAPLTIGGEQLPAGKYALFTIPGQDEWTVIINEDWKQHLADQYDEKKDIIRVKVKSQATEQNQERLRYEVLSQANKAGEIVMTWEKQKIALPIMQ